MGVVFGSPILWNRDNFTGKWPDFKEVDSYSIALNDFYPIVFPVELHKYTCAMLTIPNVIVSPDNDRLLFIVAILFNTVNKFIKAGKAHMRQFMFLLEFDIFFVGVDIPI